MQSPLEGDPSGADRMAPPPIFPPHPLAQSFLQRFPSLQGFPSLHPGSSSREFHQEFEESLLLEDDGRDISMRHFFVALGQLISTVLAIAGIVLGAVYFDQCPRQPLIPIYLIVHNTVLLFLIFLGFLSWGRGAKCRWVLLFPLHITCLTFLFVWFITGSVWVYSIYPPDYEAVGEESFCHQALFLFAFLTITVLHVVLGALLLLFLCALAFVLYAALMALGDHWGREGP